MCAPESIEVEQAYFYQIIISFCDHAGASLDGGAPESLFFVGCLVFQFTYPVRHDQM